MAGLAACDVDAEVTATVEPEGSGVVQVDVVLDAEATDALADLDDAGIVLDDLSRAGWQIEPPAPLDDGGTLVSGSKRFGTPEQFGEVMADLTGDEGIFRDFELTRTTSFARVDYTVDGVLDPSGGLSALGDPDLDATLGVPAVDLAARLGAAAETVDVEFAVRLPGEIVPGSDGVVDTSDEQIVRWSTRLDRSRVIETSATSTTRQVAPLVLRGVAAVAAVLFVLVLFGQLLRVLRPERRRRSRARTRPTPVTAAPVEPEPDVEPDPVAPGSESPTVVAIDGMGVLYREGDDVHRVLIPFAREMGSTASDAEIWTRSRSVSLGRLTTTEFWRSIGVEGEPAELDAAYVARHQLTPGVVRFLRALRDRDVRVACVTNDGTTWATALRRRHSLEGLIDPWIVSGAVGIRKPDGPIFEVLRRMTGEPAGSILVIDDDLDILDEARALGYRTAWFAPDGTDEERREHSILRGFGPDEA